jgi:hypothetical protein
VCVAAFAGVVCASVVAVHNHATHEQSGVRREEVRIDGGVSDYTGAEAFALELPGALIVPEADPAP